MWYFYLEKHQIVRCLLGRPCFRFASLPRPKIAKPTTGMIPKTVSGREAPPESLPPTGATVTFWPNGWWKLMEFRIGIIPLPIYVTLVAVIAYLIHTNKLPTDVCTMSAVIALGAFTCAELGERIPFLRVM